MRRTDEKINNYNKTTIHVATFKMTQKEDIEGRLKRKKETDKKIALSK